MKRFVIIVLTAVAAVSLCACAEELEKSVSELRESGENLMLTLDEAQTALGGAVDEAQKALDELNDFVSDIQLPDLGDAEKSEPTSAPTEAPKATSAPKATATPKATAAPKATATPTPTPEVITTYSISYADFGWTDVFESYEDDVFYTARIDDLYFTCDPKEGLDQFFKSEYLEEDDFDLRLGFRIFEWNGEAILEEVIEPFADGRNESNYEEIVVPRGVTAIGDHSFCYVDSLRKIQLPDTVTTIDEAAFIGCDGLESIELPNSVTKIMPGAFQGCRNLKSVKIPSSVISVGRGAFYDCPNLENADKLKEKWPLAFMKYSFGGDSDDWD